jgi:hypothetical protein
MKVREAKQASRKCNRVMKKIQSTLTNEELDITETERGRFLVGGSIFARPKKEEECNDDPVRNCNNRTV